MTSADRWAEYEKARDALIDASYDYEVFAQKREGSHDEREQRRAAYHAACASLDAIVRAMADQITALELALLDSYRRSSDWSLRTPAYVPWTEEEVDSIEPAARALPPAPRTQEAGNG